MMACKEINSRRIILIMILVSFLIKLQACEFKSITTKVEVEGIKECLYERLVLIDNHMNQYNSYTLKVAETYEKLREEGDICKELNSVLVYSQVPEHCKYSYAYRYKVFDRLDSQWIRLSQKVKTLKNQKIAIELKVDLLVSTYDLIIEKGKKNLKLKASIETYIQEVDKTLKEIKKFTKHRQRYLTCVTLDNVKQKIHKFSNNINKHHNKELIKTLNGLITFYKDKKSRAIYCEGL